MDESEIDWDSEDDTDYPVSADDLSNEDAAENVQVDDAEANGLASRKVCVIFI